MKNIKFMVAVFCFFLTTEKTNAQLLTNGDFDYTNPGMSQYTTTYSHCNVFDNGFLINWYRSHGTPDWIPTGHSSYGNTSPLIGLWAVKISGSNEIKGEGIVGGYNFIKGLPYTIEIKIHSATSDCQSPYDNVNLVVYATNNLKEGPAEILITAPYTYDCMDQEPTINYDGTAFQKEYIANPYLPVNASQTLTLSYTPSDNFSQIWLLGTNPGCRVYFTIDYVKIYSCVNGTVHYQTTIPSGNTQKENIFIDEDANITRNAVNQNTRLIGTNINFSSSLVSLPEYTAPWSSEIEVDNSHYFLAVAVPDCIESTGEGGGGYTDGRLANNQSNTSINELHSSSNMQYLNPNKTNQTNINQFGKNTLITIHPNPTTGQLNITMPAPGDYDVKITNMLGVVVYQGKLKDEQQKQIQLENSLSSGNYTVQITGKEVNHIEKITLTH